MELMLLPPGASLDHEGSFIMGPVRCEHLRSLRVEDLTLAIRNVRTYLKGGWPLREVMGSSFRSGAREGLVTERSKAPRALRR